jgi:integrase
MAAANGCHPVVLAAMTARRGWGENSIYFQHDGECADPARHRRCRGRWRGVISTGFGPDGKRMRRYASGTTKAAVLDKLKGLQADVDDGVKAAPPNYTVRKAAQDWLAQGLAGLSPKTIKKNENVLEPILAAIGARRLRELTATDVDAALMAMAARYSTAAVGMGHLALKRTIRHAEARDLVGRNVAVLADTPPGQAGRPSRSLTLAQAVALLGAASGRIYCYIALSLATGIRTEEARALRWENVRFGNEDAGLPASVDVWRSVRRHVDVKTERSRRTLALPRLAVNALRELQITEGRTTGLVFATRDGGELDAANVRREFRSACKIAGLGSKWTPRELRHSFVSLMSESGVPVAEIARLAGHANSRTTEIVYRKELRPVITAGAEAMDRLLAARVQLADLQERDRAVLADDEAATSLAGAYLPGAK